MQKRSPRFAAPDGNTTLILRSCLAAALLASSQNSGAAEKPAPVDATQYKQIREIWNPIQVAQHYKIPTGKLAGKGQRVAIMALGQPPSEEAIKELLDQASNHRYTGTFKVVELPGDDYDGPPSTQTGEYAMDAQIIATLCPEADITIFVGAVSFHGMADVIEAATQSGHKVITSSVGFPEDTAGKYPNTSLAGVKHLQASLRAAKDNHVTVFSASGDAGSGDRVANHAVAGEDQSVHVGILCSQHHVISCGGTELRDENGTPVETTWNNSNLHPDNPYGPAGAGTGGVSRLQPLPQWQQAFSHITHANTGKSGRIVPDVSGAASFVDWEIFEGEEHHGKWSTGASPSGGTSAVAPFYAAVFTLVNQQRALQQKEPVGWVNEWLYQNAAALQMFNDITQGDCRPRASYDPQTKAFIPVVTPYPGYDAGPGFDPCSGWGTPNGEAFFAALVNK